MPIVCSLYAHCMNVVRPLYAHCMLVVCALYDSSSEKMEHPGAVSWRGQGANKYLPHACFRSRGDELPVLCIDNDHSRREKDA